MYIKETYYLQTKLILGNYYFSLWFRSVPWSTVFGVKPTLMVEQGSQIRLNNKSQTEKLSLFSICTHRREVSEANACWLFRYVLPQVLC